MADPTISHGWVTAEPDAGKDVDADNLNDHVITGFNAAVDARVATEAALARNADNLSSGTVADARIAATIARDSEVTSAVGAEATARDSAIAAHSADTTAVHGITDTANVVLTGDARLSDARTPTAHKTSHEDGGSDEISLTGLSGTPAALTTHEAAADPHPGYLTSAEGNAAYDAAGAAAAAQAAAIAASGPASATYLVTAANAGLSAEVVVPAAVLTVLDDTTVAAMVDTLGGAASTGTGGLARATSPTFVTPILGTPASGVATNLTGTAAGLTAGTVTTNANLTGDVTSSGNATTIGAGKVTEAMQVLADNTTNNASTSKHGYLKKLSNVATEYMDGTGAFSVPAGGASAPLGITRYAPADTSVTTTSTSEVDADATNLKVTFTAPASGNVIVDVAGMVQPATSQFMYFGLRESTTNIVTKQAVAFFPSGVIALVRRQFYLTGLSAGSHTYKLSFCTAAGTVFIYFGTTYGAAEMTVWAA